MAKKSSYAISNFLKILKNNERLFYYTVNHRSNYIRHNYSAKMLSNNFKDTFHLLSLLFY